MARTIEEIQNEILTAKANEPALQELNSSSKTSIWRLWIYITAFAIWVLEKLFDTHREEINEKLRTQRVFSLPWYRDMALRFQYGDAFKLVDGKDFYDNTGKDPQEVDASKIIKYAAINEVEGVLVLKIATETNGEQGRINDEQESSFSYYISRIKPGGVEVRIINAEPDLLSLGLKIYYDPLLIKKDGHYIQPDGKEGTPVENAVKKYLKQLPFNGELVLAHLTDHLQKVKGVAIPEIYLAETKWVDDVSFKTINTRVIPNSGYFKLTNLTVEYVPNI
ncbi:nucleotidyltransferase [Riemerella anatipestifer]|nr:nucleotidyltransferase [Riemerella anatipestifer]